MFIFCNQWYTSLRVISHFCNSFLAASFRSNSQRKEFYDSRTNGISSLPAKASGVFGPLLPLDENSSSSPNSARSYGDSQLEIFNYQHGVLILHVLATLMFIPSLVAWLQVCISISMIT